MNEILQRYYEDDFCIEAEELLAMVQNRRTPQEYRADNNIITFPENVFVQTMETRIQPYTNL